VIAAELDAVRAVYQMHARRGAGGGLAGLAEIHVRPDRCAALAGYLA
jgi:hypothetical protein